MLWALLVLAATSTSANGGIADRTDTGWLPDDGSASAILADAGVARGCAALKRVDASSHTPSALERLVRAASEPLLLVNSGAALLPGRSWRRAAFLRRHGGAARLVRWPGGANQLGIVSRRATVAGFAAELRRGGGQERGLLFDSAVGRDGSAASEWAIPAGLGGAGLNDTVLSLGGNRAGLPLHNHAAAWVRIVHGEKLVVLVPPSSKATWTLPPELHARVFLPTTAALLTAGGAWEQLKKVADPTTCVLTPAAGVLLIPCNWYHGTMNLGEVVAVGGQRGDDSWRSGRCAADVFGAASTRFHKANRLAKQARQRRGAWPPEALRLLEAACSANTLSFACVMQRAGALAAGGDVAAAVAAYEASAAAYGQQHKAGLLLGPALSAILVGFVERLMSLPLASNPAMLLAMQLVELAVAADPAKENLLARVSHATMRLVTARTPKEQRKRLQLAQELASDIRSGYPQHWALAGGGRPSMKQMHEQLQRVIQQASRRQKREL